MTRRVRIRVVARSKAMSGLGGMTKIETAAGKKTHGHNEQPPERDQPRQQQPSMMKNLLMTAGVALICGVIGAAGYLYFLGAKPEESTSSQKKPDSESAKEATEKKKSGFSGTESVVTTPPREREGFLGHACLSPATLRPTGPVRASRLRGRGPSASRRVV